MLTTKIKYFLATAVVALLVMSLFSSQQTDKALIIQKLIDEAVIVKVENYEKARQKRCQDLILAEASRRADSIVIRMAKELRVLRDTANRPIAPDRPERPVSLQPFDSTAAAPLLPDTFDLDGIQPPDSTEEN